MLYVGFRKNIPPLILAERVFSGALCSIIVIVCLVASSIPSRANAQSAEEGNIQIGHAIDALRGAGLAKGRSFESGRWIDATHFRYTLTNSDGKGVVLDYDVTKNRISSVGRGVESQRTPSWPPGADVPGQPGSREQPSPDGRFAIGFDGPNLVLHDHSTKATRSLTVDGTADQPYGDGLITSWSGQVTVPRSGIAPAPSVLWSPNSDKVVSFQADARLTPVTYYLDQAPAGTAGQRQKLYTGRTAYPGESEPKLSLFVFQPKVSGTRRLSLPPLEYSGDPIRNGNVWWSRDGKTLYVRAYRQGQTQLWTVDPVNGNGKLVIAENSRTLIRAIYLPNQLTVDVAGTSDIIWFSQRDEYGHLYRYSSAGELLNRITRGPLIVSAIIGIFDGQVYFVAGVDDGNDPYKQQLFRARLDGTSQEQLTHDGLDHDVTASPDGTRFVIEAFSIDRLRRTSIVDREGRELIELARPALGDRIPRPERISVPGRDGKTLIWGVMFKPSDFDPAKHYPIIHYVYGGAWTPFSPRSRDDRRAFYAQSMAELGFIVLMVDGMGTPGRTRSFNTLAFGKGFNDCGLPDAIIVMQTLARNRSYFDLDHVGITGNSGGGYCALRGMLDHPDVFTVGVSSSGSQDQRIVGASWGETYIGAIGPDDDAYHVQSNVEAATRLKGKLLLMHGLIDDDTNAANTLQVSNALIGAGIDFDMFLFPTANHALTLQPYYYKKLWTFLARHLQARELDPDRIAVAPF